MTTPFSRVRDELRTLKVNIIPSGGEYHVWHKHSRREDAHITEDLQDALTRGREIGLNPPPEPEPSMGPLPNPYSMRSKIRKHNAPIAKARAKRARRNKS